MTDKVVMTALDTLHISNVSADNLRADDVFIVSEADAKALEKSGGAKRGGAAAKAVNGDNPSNPDLRPETREEIDAERGFKEGRVLGAKAEAAAPENKMEAAPENKAAISARSAPAKPARKSK